MRGGLESPALFIMGTNYYLLQDPGPNLHIGKSSYGWVFALHIYPELGIHDWEDWAPLLAFGEIRDEYGSSISLGTMVSIVTERDFYVTEKGHRHINRHDETLVTRRGSAWDCIEGDFS